VFVQHYGSGRETAAEHSSRPPQPDVSAARTRTGGMPWFLFSVPPPPLRPLPLPSSHRRPAGHALTLQPPFIPALTHKSLTDAKFAFTCVCKQKKSGYRHGKMKSAFEFSVGVRENFHFIRGFAHFLHSEHRVLNTATRLLRKVVVELVAMTLPAQAQLMHA
jgi:hypothetical protein